MKGVDNSLVLGIGNASLEKELGAYYQDISPAIVHITRGIFARFDNNGIPIYGDGTYKPVLVIQYGLMCYDLLLQSKDAEGNKRNIENCINWLDNNKEKFKDSYVWRSDYDQHYNLEKGWISGMYQGQAISLYLRAYQLFNDDDYLITARTIFNSFKYDYSEGGFKRIDELGCIWFEEYPSKQASFVLNGYIYSILGILDLFRITGEEEYKKLWDSCVNTLEQNLHKYDVWYWSVYDQLHKELVSYYYQKNVHTPLMQIMYALTKKEIFNKYAIKWEKNLNNSIHRVLTVIMYRVKPRIEKLFNR